MDKKLILEFLQDMEGNQKKYPNWSIILVQMENIKDFDKFASFLTKGHLELYDFNGNNLAHHALFLPKEEIAEKFLQVCHDLNPECLLEANVLKISPVFSYLCDVKRENYNPKITQILAQYIDSHCIKFFSEHFENLKMVGSFMNLDTLEKLTKVGSKKVAQWAEYEYLKQVEQNDKKLKIKLL